MAGSRKRDRGQSRTALRKLHNTGLVYREKEKLGPFFRPIFTDIPCFWWHVWCFLIWFKGFLSTFISRMKQYLKSIRKRKTPTLHKNKKDSQKSWTDTFPKIISKWQISIWKKKKTQHHYLFEIDKLKPQHNIMKPQECCPEWEAKENFTHCCCKIVNHLGKLFKLDTSPTIQQFHP